jgi:hypothetical protein
LRSFADTENPRYKLIGRGAPIFASVAEQILKSTFETQMEEFAPELAKKLEMLHMDWDECRGIQH